MGCGGGMCKTFGKMMLCGNDATQMMPFVDGPTRDKC